MITPALITQVNAAAASNPTLANLLQLAALGKASPEQLKTLGILIQSLAAATGTAAPYQLPAPAAAPSTTLSTVPKEFDLVIEFSEAPADRWVLPRGPVLCERVIEGNVADAAYDVIITTRVPFPEAVSSGNGAASESVKSASPQVLTFRLLRAPLPVWDLISRWVGGEEKMKESRKVLDKLVRTHGFFWGTIH